MPIVITVHAPMLSAWGPHGPSARPGRPEADECASVQRRTHPLPSVGRAEIRNDRPWPFLTTQPPRVLRMLGNPIQGWQRITCSAANSLAPTLTIS